MADPANTATRVPRIFDKRRRAARHRRALARQAQGEEADYLRVDMADDVIERIDFMQLAGGRALVIGELGGTFPAALEQRGFAVRKAGPDTLDEEAPLTDGPFDAIVSLAALDTVNDLPGALLHLRGALEPAEGRESGLLFAQMPGAGSLPALRSIMLAADGESPAARIHPQVDNRSAAALLQRAGFSRQVVDGRKLTVRYSSLARMVSDLRDQALTGVLADRPPPLTRGALARAKAAFETLREPDGKVSETIEILALTGWR